MGAQRSSPNRRTTDVATSPMITGLLGFQLDVIIDVGQEDSGPAELQAMSIGASSGAPGSTACMRLVYPGEAATKPGMRKLIFGRYGTVLEATEAIPVENF